MRLPQYSLPIGLSLLSAALSVFAFPDYFQWRLAWIGFAPLLYALAEVRSVKWAFLLGQLYGICFFYGVCYWITYSMIHYGGLPPAAAYGAAFIPVFIVALFPAVFAAATARLLQAFGDKALLLAPFVWAAVEYLRLQVTGVGWNFFGYSFGFQPELLWPARYGGVYLISAMIVFPSAALALAIKRRSRSSIALVAASVIFWLIIYAAGKTPSVPPPNNESGGIDVIAVQGNVPVGELSQDELNKYLIRQFDMTRDSIPARPNGEAPRETPVVVVWPEAPFNFQFDKEPELQRAFGDFTRFHGIYLLFNASVSAGPKRDYNSVIAIGPSGEQIGQYDKIHLLPFGEYVPFRDYLPLIDRIPALAGDFTPSDKYSPILIEGTAFGTFICFESVFPDVAREMARAGAGAFINVADDAWFGPTPIDRQHLAHVAMRAAETGLPLLRVTNTGITARISADGRVSDETPLFETAVRKWRLAVNYEKPALTFYARFGDLFAIACAIVILILLAYGHFKLVRKCGSAEVRKSK